MASEMKRVSDVIGSGDINFYPEYPRMELEDVLGKDWVIMDIEIMRNWKSDFGTGTSDWCLIAIQNQETGENFTTKCGGQVLVKRMADLKARKAFPIIGSIIMKGDTERPYYQII